MHITSTDGATRIAHDGQTFEPVQGFTFDLPDPLAAHLLRFPQWRIPTEDDLALPHAGVPEVKPRRPRKTAAPAE